MGAFAEPNGALCTCRPQVWTCLLGAIWCTLRCRCRTAQDTAWWARRERVVEAYLRPIPTSARVAATIVEGQAQAHDTTNGRLDELHAEIAGLWSDLESDRMAAATERKAAAAFAAAECNAAAEFAAAECRAAAGVTAAECRAAAGVAAAECRAAAAEREAAAAEWRALLQRLDDQAWSGQGCGEERAPIAQGCTCIYGHARRSADVIAYANAAPGCARAVECLGRSGRHGCRRVGQQGHVS